MLLANENHDKSKTGDEAISHEVSGINSYPFVGK